MCSEREGKESGKRKNFARIISKQSVTYTTKNMPSLLWVGISLWNGEHC